LAFDSLRNAGPGVKTAKHFESARWNRHPLTVRLSQQMELKLKTLALLLLVPVTVCSAQTSAPDDPTLDPAGVPWIVRQLPQPAPEPWQKITAKQRWTLYQQKTFSGSAVLGAAAGAAFSQWMDSPTEWGQGAEGYGRRLASSYGATIINGTIQYGTSALFHDDNRYHRSMARSFGGRFGAVVISPFVAYNDHGGKRFSTSSFLGGAGQSTIPLAWSPRSWQGGSEIGINALIWYGQTAGANLVREFYPSIAAHFRKKAEANASQRGKEKDAPSTVH